MTNYIKQDLKQPGPAIGPALIAVESLPCNKISLLNGVAGLGLIEGEADRGAEQIVHVRQGFHLEFGQRLGSNSWRDARLVHMAGFSSLHHPQVSPFTHG